MSTTTAEIMTPALRTKLALVGMTLALFAVVFVGAKAIHYFTPERLAIPDEQSAAAALLEQKLSGPNYFTRTASEPTTQAAPGEVRITLADAQAQLPRITQARHFDAEKTARLSQLIQQLAEPSPSRVVGDPTVDILRLNLALDALR